MIRTIIIGIAILGWMVAAFRLERFPFRRFRLQSVTFACYIVLLLVITLSPNPYLEYAAPRLRGSLIPFEVVVRTLGYPTLSGVINLAIDLAGNLVLFIPFGFVAGQRQRRLLLAACLVSGMIELVQSGLSAMWHWNRIASTTDVLLNVAGTAIGYRLWRILQVCDATDDVDAVVVSVPSRG